MSYSLKLWAARLFFVAAAISAAAACNAFTTPVAREYLQSQVLVLWYELPNEAALNEKCQRSSEDRKILACAVLSADRGTCTVYTHRNPALEILGHEFLHCFTGRWHG